ncbi:MAG: hypothetical protein WC889_07805 [Myxococcota bacterium]|jgi:membrane-bound ClpP family serine protease
MIGTIYIVCFLVGAGLTIARSLLSFMGGDTNDDFHPDMSADADADGESPGMGLLNMTVISVFVSVFGGVGALMHYLAHAGTGLSLPVAAGGAFLTALLVGLLLNKIVSSTQAGSEPVSITGLPAMVITPIPENGLGEIAYVARGSRYTSAAREKNGEKVENNTPVKIIELSGSVCLVERKG